MQRQLTNQYPLTNGIVAEHASHLHVKMESICQSNSDAVAIDVDTTTIAAGNLRAGCLDDRIFIRTNSGCFQKVLVDDILFFEANRAYTIVRTAASKFTLSGSMGRILKSPAFGNMVRIHKSHAVNLKSIDAITDDGVLVGSHCLPIGHLFKSSFLRTIILLR